MSHALGKLAHRCLVCHEHIGEWHGASVRCPWCDEVNLRVDQERCWTLSPRARLIERVLKYGGTVGVAVTTYALLGFDGTPTAEGWKVFAVMGTLIPAALWWDMTSLVTRRRSRTRIEVSCPRCSWSSVSRRSCGRCSRHCGATPRTSSRRS